MAQLQKNPKACTVNPLKMSQPIGGALAFMGMRGCMPLLHGSQGCTSFGLVLFVRHFREAIPLQTTAMSEVATVLGGYENVEQAICNIAKRTKPEMIGICSTGVTETKGDDVAGYIKLIRDKHPELDDIALVYVSTPDFKDAFQDGWAKAVTAIVEALVEAPPAEILPDPRRINVLPGCHITPGDIDELRDLFEAFGLLPTFLPDLSGSLDGHIPDDFTPTTIGGTGCDAARAMGLASWTLAIGEQMRSAAEVLERKAGVPFRLFDRLPASAAVPARASVRHFFPAGAGPQRERVDDLVLEVGTQRPFQKAQSGVPGLAIAHRRWCDVACEHFPARLANEIVERDRRGDLPAKRPETEAAGKIGSEAVAQSLLDPVHCRLVRLHCRRHAESGERIVADLVHLSAG